MKPIQINKMNTMPVMNDPFNLEQIESLHKFWKPGAYRAVALIVLRGIQGGARWVDQIDVATIPMQHRSCIGTVMGALYRNKIIESSGEFRKSSRKGSNVRKIFGFTLENPALLSAVVKKLESTTGSLDFSEE